MELHEYVYFAGVYGAYGTDLRRGFVGIIIYMIVFFARTRDACSVPARSSSLQLVVVV